MDSKVTKQIMAVSICQLSNSISDLGKLLQNDEFTDTLFFKMEDDLEDFIIEVSDKIMDVTRKMALMKLSEGKNEV
jgi:hypothetical protein